MPPAKTIRVNGVDLTYVEQGHGEAVVLIHGFLHDYRLWSGQISQFSKRYRVIAYSMRHRWPSKPPGDNADISAAANLADLVGLARALKLDRAHLIGHSGGAGLALRVARDHPEVVRSMVLGEPGGNAFAVSSPEAAPRARPAWQAEAQQAYERGDTAGAIQIVAEAVLGKEAAARPMPAWVHKMLLDNAWQLKLVGASIGREPPVTCPEAQRIKVPALLLGGDQSPAIFRLVLDGLEKCLPTRERAILLGASHGLELENPAGFNEIVLKFLAKYSTPRTGRGALAPPPRKQQRGIDLRALKSKD